MKLIILSVAAALAVTAVNGLSQQCNEEFGEGIKCYINKADGIVHQQGVQLNLDDLEHCINEKSSGCGQSMSRELGSDYSNVDEDTLEKCADQTLGQSQDQIQGCMKKKFPDVKFGTKSEQKDSPGLRLIVLLGSLKQGYKTCRDITQCVPENYKEIKAALCKAEGECFSRDFDRRCPTTEKDVSDATCNCYKQIPNKNQLVKDFNDCCGVQSPRDLLSFASSRVAQSGILKTIENKLCSGRDSYTARFGICESDELEKATKSQQTLSGLSRLLNGGNANSNSGSRFGGLFGGRGGFGRK